MSWKSTLLEFCKRHGEMGKFAAKTVLGAVLPGSPVVVDLVGRALDCAVETGKDHWDIANEPAMSDADAARLAEVLDLLQGNLAALIPTLMPLQSVPDIAKQVLAAQMVADEKLAGLAVEIQQSAEQFDAFADQQRQILEHQRFAGDALVEMLEIMRPMAGMADFFCELKASGIGGHEIASAVAIFRAGQEAFASGNVTSARKSFATFATAHESMPAAPMVVGF